MEWARCGVILVAAIRVRSDGTAKAGSRRAPKVEVGEKETEQAAERQRKTLRKTPAAHVAAGCHARRSGGIGEAKEQVQ